MPTKDFQFARLQKILQRLKSLILQDLPALQRQQIKDTLVALAHAYQTGALPFDEYKIQAVKTLTHFRSLTWTEQFLYRETGTFFTPAEKFTLTDSP
jgi:hypothetical protein